MRVYGVIKMIRCMLRDQEAQKTTKISPRRSRRVASDLTIFLFCRDKVIKTGKGVTT